VLSQPDREDAELLEAAIERAIEALLVAIGEGFEMAMNRYNRAAAATSD
jgi:peptidyl-tRNA hydrolase